MSIGEFGSRSRLSAKALRLYDELSLLPPARVDEDSGYHFYEPGQLKQARLIAALRQCAGLLEGDRQVGRDGGFADAAFAAGDRDDRGDAIYALR